MMIRGQTGNPTKMSQWIFDAYEKKEKIARSIKGRKIVIVAGSNALFGVDSRMLSDAYGLPVINDSVNAGIELPTILYLAKRVIGSGDVVIVPLEYPMYSYEGKPGMQMIDYIFSRVPEFFVKLTLKEQLYMVWHVSFKRIQNGYLHAGDQAVTKGLYGAHHIDANGDQNETEVSYRNEAMQAEVQNHMLHPETYGAKYDSGALGWEYLEAFTRWCRERDAKVIFMPSTLMEDASYRNEPKEQWFYTHIVEEVRERGWTYVGDPYDYMYDQALYLNTNFHLIDRGRKIRTEKMIDDLNASGMLP